MKLSAIILVAAFATEAACSTLIATPTVTTIDAPATTTHSLERRARKNIVNPEYQKLQDAKADAAAGKTDTSSTTEPKAWQRTIYGDKVELVRPTVIGGVTFSAKPPKTTNGLEPWISLNKDGSPKTIIPQMKNGHIKNPSPTYGDYFATATTVVYTQEELKAHNMAEDETYEEVSYIPEDSTYQSLNPLIRCTPERYFNKGLAKNVKSEPFCSPHDQQLLKMSKTYFITWYSKFFDENVENIKLHYSYVREAAMVKGFKKRSEAIEVGGSIEQQSFYVSDWINKDQGYYPFEVLEEWFSSAKEFNRKILISIQADNVPDDEFDVLDKYVVIEIARGAKVGKGGMHDLKKLDELQRMRELGIEIEDDSAELEKYYIMMGLPMCVTIAALCMYLFVWINKSGTDLSGLKKRKAAGKNTSHKRLFWKGSKKDGYNQLPQHNKDIELQKMD